MGGIPYKEFIYKLSMAQGYQPLFALPLKTKWRYTFRITGRALPDRSRDANFIVNTSSQYGDQGRTVFKQSCDYSNGYYYPKWWNVGRTSDYEIQVYRGTEHRPTMHYLGRIAYQDSEMFQYNYDDIRLPYELQFTTGIPEVEMEFTESIKDTESGYYWRIQGNWLQDITYELVQEENQTYLVSHYSTIEERLYRCYYDGETKTTTQSTLEESMRYVHDSAETYVTPLFPMFEMREGERDHNSIWSGWISINDEGEKEQLSSTITYSEGMTEELYQSIYEQFVKGKTLQKGTVTTSYRDWYVDEE